MEEEEVVVVVASAERAAQRLAGGLWFEPRGCLLSKFAAEWASRV